MQYIIFFRFYKEQLVFYNILFFYLLSIIMSNVVGQSVKDGLRMDIILKYNWEIFITLEVLSMGALILFGVLRYFFNKFRVSLLFIALFIFILLLESGLALFVYFETGEISTFQIVIAVFIVYALTFGINDFLKLDQWMRIKIGKFRGVDLLTEKDHKIIKRNEDPRYIARKNRISAYIHLMIFVIGQSVLWMMGTDSLEEMKMYLTDFSWLENKVAEGTPYPNDITLGIGVIWGIAFIADFLYSWSYTLFPKEK